MLSTLEAQVANRPRNRETPLVNGALARTVEMAGALESVSQQTVQYAGEQVQLARPIGKYKAISGLFAVDIGR